MYDFMLHISINYIKFEKQRKCKSDLIAKNDYY